MSKTLQQLIDETPEGGVLHLGEAEYKESVVVSKNITIVGAVDKSDDPWYDCDYKTLIEGSVVITALTPVFEGCSFDFGDKPLILENGVSPSFKNCFFEADQLIAEVKDENTNPRFYSCRFAGPEDELGLCIKNGAKGYFEKCRLEFCSVSVQDPNTNPKFIDCSLNSVDCVALCVENGACGIFEDVGISTEMDVEPLFIEGDDTSPEFLKCNIYGFPYAMDIASGARPTFEKCKIGGHSIDPEHGYSDYVLRLIDCSTIFASCDFSDVNTRVFYSKNVQAEFINCKFNDLKELDFPDFRFVKNVENPSLVKQLVAILSSQNVLHEIEKYKDEYFEFIDHYMIGCEHKKFHCEGDVREHTKLVIQIIVAEKHDWIDVLTALMHDVGKKDALERNNGKNMHGHELYSERIAAEWLDKMGFGEDLKKKVLWIIHNHMLALDLKVMKSKFRIFDFVRNPLFYRVARLARADCRGTLDECGCPHDDFDEILKRPIVKDCRNLAFILPIIDKDNVSVSDKMDKEQVQKFFEILDKVKENGNVDSYDDLIRTTIETMVYKNGR